MASLQYISIHDFHTTTVCERMNRGEREYGVKLFVIKTMAVGDVLVTPHSHRL